MNLHYDQLRAICQHTKLNSMEIKNQKKNTKIVRDQTLSSKLGVK